MRRARARVHLEMRPRLPGKWRHRRRHWRESRKRWHRLAMTLIKCAAPTGEGSLLLHHYVSLYLQAGHAVCLCGFEQVPEPRARIAVRQSAGGAVCARRTHTHT